MRGCAMAEVSLIGLSKSFGLPGLRMGWIVSHDRELLQRITVLKDYTTICNSAPDEILAIIALRSRADIIRQQVQRVRRNLAVLNVFFHEYHDCFTWERPRGGSICFPRVLAVQDTFAFCEELVRDTGIMLVPSRMFQFGDHHVRVGFGRDNLPVVIDRFADYLDRRFR